MHPDQMTIVLRERSGLEGADLGMRLLQEHLRTVYLPWLALMVPIYILCLATGWWNPLIATFLLWWLAPVGERLVVLVLSQTAFGHRPSWREALALLRNRGLHGIFWQLTILRLSPHRGLLTPVLALEKPTFAAYRRRAGTLAKGQMASSGLSLAFVHAEGFVQLSALGLLAALMPQHSVPWEELLDTLGSNAGAQLFNVLYAVSLLLLRPFYPAAGFGMYLSRRTALEGWDIELAFRAMARRLATTATALAVGLFCIVIAPDAAVAAPPPADVAAETDTPAADAGLDPVRTTINGIVNAPPFRNDFEEKHHFDFSWMAPDERPNVPLIDGTWLSLLVRVLAILLLGLLIYLAVRACLRIRVPPEWLPEIQQDAIPARSGRAEIETELPADPGAVAAELAAAGRHREALSLLIRAAIVHFRVRAAIPIPSGATESECLRRITGQVPQPVHDHFRDTARLWQTLAYAARPVAAEHIIALASSFRTTYAPPSGEQPSR